MKWVVSILVNAVLFIAISGFFPDSFYIAGFGAAVGASFILSILNILVRPLLIILTLPVTILSLGLFLFVINAFTLVMTDSLMGSAFEISSFGMAIVIAMLMSLANLVIQQASTKSNRR